MVVDVTQFIEVLIGLPGSGKSTYANQFKESLDVVVISSDAIREELLGDIDNQSKKDKVFDEYYKRAKEVLTKGKSVILDATNLTFKSRKNIFERLSKFKNTATFKARYFSGDFTQFSIRNQSRSRIVPNHVMGNMYKSLQIPMYQEGWDEIILDHKDDLSLANDVMRIMIEMEKKITNKDNTHEELFGFGCQYDDVVKGIVDLPQDNPHHTFSVSRHSYHVWKYIVENFGEITGVNDEEERLVMLWSAIFHDVGKAFCKNFKVYEDGYRNKYANFIGHEFVGAQMAANFLLNFYNDQFVLRITDIIQNHMRIMQLEGASNKAKEKFEAFVGKELNEKLFFFYVADTSAK